MNSSTGKIVAAIIFTALVGLVVWGLTRSSASKPAEPSAFEGITPQPSPSDGLLGSVEGSVFQSFDPETGELRYELRWDTLDPVGQGRYELTKPVASFFQGDATVRVEAMEGELLWPSRDEEPESGNLRGEVLVTVRENNSEQSQVLGTLQTEDLFFQSVLGELNAPEFVRITAPGMEFEGKGLTVRVSEVQKRLQYLRVNEHLGTTIRPDQLRRGRRASGVGSSDQTADPSPTSPSQPLIDLYRVAIENRVELEQGGRRITADEADVWVRLRDRSLARGAIAPLRIGPIPAEDATRDAAAGSDQARPGSGESTESSEPILFRNSGSIEITPIAQFSPQLESDDLATRFRATSSPAVVLSDEESGAEIRCGSLSWGFGSRRLAVRGVGGSLGVEFDFPGEASVRTGALDVDLAAGIGAFPGAGRVEILSGLSGRGEATAIEWTERADIVLDTSSPASRQSSTPLIRWLTASGDIEATTETTLVTGQFLRADFTSRLLDGVARNDLSRVSVEENSRTIIRDGDTNADIAANRLEVLFSPERDRAGDERLVPTRASALGSAVALVNGDRLTGQTVDAVLLAGDEGSTTVQSIDASENVTLRTREGLDLVAEALHASEATGTLTLVGYPASVGVFTDAQGGGVSAADDYHDAFNITGESIRFDRGPRRLTVFGGGVLSYATKSASLPGYDTGSVRWDRSMRFEDQIGSAEFNGNVHTESKTQDGQQYRASADRLLLTLVPDLLDEDARRASRQSVSDTDAVLAVRLEARTGEFAVAEAYQYSSGAADSTLETAARLSGEQIIAQRDTERLLVPGPGRLVFEDRRESDTPIDPDTLPTDGRGTTVFDWSGSLDALSAERRITMNRDVRMRHRHLGADSLTTVETERLTATLEEAKDESTTRYIVNAVDAEGAVLATHRESQVVADRLTYSSEMNRIIASALEGNRVTFFDAETGRHLPAERVMLDLITGRWRIEQAGQITTPLEIPD